MSGWEPRVLSGGVDAEKRSRLEELLRLKEQALKQAKSRLLAEKMRERDKLRALDREDTGSMAAFARVVWPIVEPGTPLVWNWHLDLLFGELQQQANGAPSHRKLLVNMPPGAMKSLACFVIAPAWEWLHDPSRRKLVLSQDESLSVRDSRRMRQIVTDPEYQELADRAAKARGDREWRISSDQNQRVNFETTERGFRQCLGITSKATGKRGDDLCIDDPMDVKQVVIGSPEAIEKRCQEVNTNIDAVLSSRVNDLSTARHLLVMQRLHINDPAGHAIRDGGWRVVCLPMTYDPDHPHIHPDDPRAPGELLFPAKFPAAEVATLAKKLDRAGMGQSAAQLEQRPGRIEGGRIRREHFAERYRATPVDIAKTADEVSISVDAAKKREANSDFHAMHVWARVGARRMLLARVSERMTYPEFERVLDGLIEEWKWAIQRTAGVVLIEDQANGTTYIQVRRRRYGFLVPFQPARDTPGKDKSKAARFVYVERAAEAGAIVLPEAQAMRDVEELVGQWCAFPAVSHDDDCDAASQLLMRWELHEDEMPAVSLPW